MKQQLEMKDNEKLLFFNDCNFQVAVLCNHCKTPAKNFGEKQDEKKKQLLEMEKVSPRPAAPFYCHWLCLTRAVAGPQRAEKGQSG
jgi:hypothetical protein